MKGSGAESASELRDAKLIVRSTERSPRRVGVTVVVTRSTEAIDFDAWAARWVRAAIAIDRAETRVGGERENSLIVRAD